MKKFPMSKSFGRPCEGTGCWMLLESLRLYVVVSCTTRVVLLPKRTETSLITESDQRASNH